MIISCLLSLLLIELALGQIIRFCDEFECSDFYDPVCGSAKSRDGTKNIATYYNICYMRKKQCELGRTTLISEVPHHVCNIVSDLPTDTGFRRSVPNMDAEAPRVQDFSIVGAHQVCNHTCPTFCSDAYDPVCAQVWNRGSDSIFSRRAMVNHCHVDMFSCATGLNVTISPLYQCYKNPSGLMFMKNMAALKSLKLMDDARRSYGTSLKSKPLPLWDIIRRTVKDISDTLQSNSTGIENDTANETEPDNDKIYTAATPVTNDYRRHLFNKEIKI